jgi:elongation factor Ts
MSDTNVSILKALRERTGAGIIACRNALIEAGGDTDRAADILRQKEAVVAQAKAHRVATQGMVGVQIQSSRAALVELNCESDFVARSSAFVNTVSECLRIALDEPSLDGRALRESDRFDALIASLSARTGERIVLSRTAIVPVTPDHVVATYVHGSAGPSVGSIATVLNTNLPPSTEAHALARGLAMHIAASAPRWISHDDVPADVIETWRSEFASEAQRAGKPAAILEKIVSGRLQKSLDASTLLGQPYVLNPDERVGDVLLAAEAVLGTAITVGPYVRFQVGESAERQPV